MPHLRPGGSSTAASVDSTAGVAAAADGSEIAAGMVNLLVSFMSPLVSVAKLLLNTTAQIGGGLPAAIRPSR